MRKKGNSRFLIRKKEATSREAAFSGEKICLTLKKSQKDLLNNETRWTKRERGDERKEREKERGREMKERKERELEREKRERNEKERKQEGKILYGIVALKKEASSLSLSCKRRKIIFQKRRKKEKKLFNLIAFFGSPS